MKVIKIAVVGGGISGLAAAYLLKKLSYPDVQLKLHLFEATHRVGGRIHTLRGFTEDLYAELGAISISDNEQDILNLAQELDVNLIKRLDRQQRRYFIEGKWQEKSDIGTIMIFLMQPGLPGGLPGRTKNFY